MNAPIPFRGAQEEPAAAPLLLPCNHCKGTFDARKAEVCGCVTQHRSLVCSACGSCWCAEPVGVRRERIRSLTPEIVQRMRGVTAEVKRPYPVVLKRPLVVVADDDFDILSITRRHLEEAGYGVVAVSDGEAAWDAVVEYKPDLVVADGLMPRLDGRELSKRIKSAAHTRHIPVVVMTSLYTGVAQKEEAFRLFGVDAYLAKPVKPQVLRDTIEGLGVLP